MQGKGPQVAGKDPNTECAPLSRLRSLRPSAPRLHPPSPRCRLSFRRVRRPRDACRSPLSPVANELLQSQRSSCRCNIACGPRGTAVAARSVARARPLCMQWTRMILQERETERQGQGATQSSCSSMRGVARSRLRAHQVLCLYLQVHGWRYRMKARDVKS